MQDWIESAHNLMQDNDRRITELERENLELERRIEVLEQRDANVVHAAQCKHGQVGLCMRCSAEDLRHMMENTR